jgi:hypothetical protein
MWHDVVLGFARLHLFGRFRNARERAVPWSSRRSDWSNCSPPICLRVPPLRERAGHIGTHFKPNPSWVRLFSICRKYQSRSTDFFPACSRTLSPNSETFSVSLARVSSPLAGAISNPTPTPTPSPISRAPTLPSMCESFLPRSAPLARPTRSDAVPYVSLTLSLMSSKLSGRRSRKD